jgi:hypothetical protein
MWGVEARWYLLNQTRKYGIERVRLGRKQPQRRAWHFDDFGVAMGRRVMLMLLAIRSRGGLLSPDWLATPHVASARVSIAPAGHLTSAAYRERVWHVMNALAPY